ncbi:hypothetical protein ACLKMY_21835 [Paraburkholderia mimosarum]|uniref:hypothetical protein n=1 Tax=Paraburkholderia mimosarum TaxID=312026 RepID=UPI0039C4B7E2
MLEFPKLIFFSGEIRRFGHISAENRETQAIFGCAECGHTANADRRPTSSLALDYSHLVFNGSTLQGLISGTL